MANKRQAKKAAKKKQLQKIQQAGVALPKKSRRSAAEIEKTYKHIVAKEAKEKQRAERKKAAKEARAAKLEYKRRSLDALGFNPKHAGKVKYDDIEKYKRGQESALSRAKYSFLYYGPFDFDKIHKLKNGQRMFIAFRDYQGELDIESELARFSKYSNAELLDGLEAIVNQPPTYRKGGGGSGRAGGGKGGGTSSGKAGDFKFMIADNDTLQAFNKEAKKQTAKDKRRKNNMSKASKRKLKRGHFKGDNVGYQVLKDGRRLSFDEVTPRNLLIMANAIMYNVTEKDRITFYGRFYTDIIKHIPEMREILPVPRF